MRLILFLSVLSIQAGCQHLNPISVEMLDTSLLMNKVNQKLIIQFNCKNKSDSVFLLYGIDGETRNIGVIKAEELCNHFEKMSAGCALYIYNSSMKRRGTYAPLISREIDNKPMTPERVDSIMISAKMKYLESTRIIRGSETIYLKKEVDLKDFKLEKGVYYLQIVYFSGKSISSMVAPIQIESDKKNYKALVYQGCAISSRVKFRVE